MPFARIIALVFIIVMTIIKNVFSLLPKKFVFKEIHTQFYDSSTNTPLSDVEIDVAWWVKVKGIREQLSHDPLKETRNRKKLRKNPVAPWELRLGKYRVFYEVHGELITVGVVAVGYKQHNTLYIRGKQVEL